MRFPPPLSVRSRLLHGLAAIAGRPLRRRFGGAVPAELLLEPEAIDVPTAVGAFHTLAWNPPDRGDLPPAVLVHGLNANARYWNGTACVLSGAGRAVYAPDMRGHGGTGPLPGGYELPQTRADLEALLDRLGLERVDLIGHSWGGKVSLDFAAAHPERIRRLCLVDPVPPQGLRPLIVKSEAAVGAVFSPERGPFADAEELAAARSLISWLRHAEPWMHHAFDANFRAEADGSLRHVLPPEDFDEIFERVLPAPSPLPLDSVAPALLVRASLSVLTGGQARAMKRALPRLHLVRVPGEHSLHATNPVGLARALISFLEPE